MSEPTEILEFMHILADRSGELLRKFFRQPLHIDIKTDASPVTEADRQVEAMLRTMIGNRFPAHGVRGEEYPDTDVNHLEQWILDPLDGTRSFIAGLPLFTTLIAYSNNQKLIVGMIDQPVLKERWTGGVGQQTTLNGQAVQPSSCQSLSKAIVGTTSTTYFNAIQAQAFERINQRAANVILGGDAYLYAMLASGNIDVVIDTGLKLYDFCAVVPIVTGAGAIITDWNGQNITLASDGTLVAAATQHLHNEIMELLNA
jgi:inositol-phosphate phosphatase / L-galactose 1-phosphate phosphatase / histidinol-phosphatase